MYQSSEPIVALLFSCSGPTLPLSGVLGKVGQVTPSAVLVAVPPSAVGPTVLYSLQGLRPEALVVGEGTLQALFPPMTSPRSFPPAFRVRCGLFGQLFADMASPTSRQMGAGDDPVGVQAPLGSQETPPPFFGSTLLCAL